MASEKTLVPQFGTIYLAVRPETGTTEPFRFLNLAMWMRKPFNNDRLNGRMVGHYCGVWVFRDNGLGQTDFIEPITSKWLSRKIRGMKKQIETKQKKLDNYNKLANLVS